MILKGVKVTLSDGSVHVVDLDVPIPETVEAQGVKFGNAEWINGDNLHPGWDWNPHINPYEAIIATGAFPSRSPTLFAIRGSEAPAGSMYSNDNAIAYQDLPKERGANGVYARYTEVTVGEMAHDDSRAQGHEIALINRRPYAPKVTPRNPNPPGLVEGHRVIADSLGNKRAYNVSVAYSIVANGAKFKTGINFAHDAIEEGGDAIALAEGQKISWHGPDGTVTSVTVQNGKMETAQITTEIT